MQFNRMALREAAEAALKADQETHDAENQRRADEYAAAGATWVEQYAEAWLAALPRIRATLRKGEPLRPSDLPVEDPRWRDRPALFYTNPPRLKPYDRGSELLSLISLLDTVADDTVSNRALAELGVGRTALRAAVAYLGKGQVRSS